MELIRKTYRVTAILAGLLLIVIPRIYAQVDRSIAHDFNKRMGRGINFMASKINADQHDPLDFKLIRENNFTHVRIGGHLWKPENVSDDGNVTINAARMQGFKNAVDWALAEGLLVVMDPIHYWRDYSDGDLPKMERLWKQIATTFAHYPVNKVAFEIMNEPESYDFDLRAIITKSLSAIRNIPGNENRIVIVSGQGFSTRQALITALNNDIFPTNDSDLIGTFHYYDPRNFTKQGQTGLLLWGESGDDDPDWNAVSQAFDQVVEANESWAARNDTSALPVYCGEFGADNGAPANDRKRWMWWIRMASEKREFSTAIWNLYNTAPDAKGIGPWGQEQINNPSTRSLDTEIVEAIMTRYEAEEASLQAGLVSGSSQDGASSSRYVDFSNAASGTALNLGSIYLGRSGNYDLSIRYGNKSDNSYTLTIGVYDKEGSLVDEETEVSVPPTDDAWNTIAVSLDFPAGKDNSVKISAAQNSPTLVVDYICVTNGLYFDNFFPP